MPAADSTGFMWSDAGHTDAHRCLVEPVLRTLERSTARRVFDLGCGNGSFANLLADRGYDVTGVDPSEHGLATATSAYPGLRLARGSAYDDLAATYGQFPAVISLEVVEHVYSPRLYAKTLFALVAPGGLAIVSTPYHGYWKNLALALSGKMDRHFTALWDHGHIKFWSIDTLGTLLTEAGFSRIMFERVGRIPPLAKSMIAVCHKD
ncbi:class I SAM-dependent methyltransferase [Azospirillum halopraeferens]|uniref:class I SAM-dependent methyltransferase n=1 Tax=Azospirillum halopraeferens TaxID=34010 RepID=UPI0004139805|nr:class I SAM-dependent methyltransferase [Azospirillum halopraeferens]